MSILFFRDQFFTPEVFRFEIGIFDCRDAMGESPCLVCQSEEQSESGDLIVHSHSHSHAVTHTVLLPHLYL